MYFTTISQLTKVEWYEMASTISLLPSFQQCIDCSAFHSLMGGGLLKKEFGSFISFHLRILNNVPPSAAVFSPTFHLVTTLLQVMKNGFCMSTENEKYRGHQKMRNQCQHQNRESIHKSERCHPLLSYFSM